MCFLTSFKFGKQVMRHLDVFKRTLCKVIFHPKYSINSCSSLISFNDSHSQGTTRLIRNKPETNMYPKNVPAVRPHSSRLPPLCINPYVSVFSPFSCHKIQMGDITAVMYILRLSCIYYVCQVYVDGRAPLQQEPYFISPTITLPDRPW